MMELEPDRLLFTDKDGAQSDLQDVICDGLDRDYSDRYPALVRLMREGEPEHRLFACVMLASWGVEEGFLTLIQWARHPEAVPWVEDPVTYDRHYGVDGAFEMLADAIQVAGDIEGREKVEPLRREATRALLGIYDRVYFARALMVLLDIDRALAASVREEIASAVGRAVDASGEPGVAFDMAAQAAFLLGPLASLDDERAAAAAEMLISMHSEKSRTLREVAYALGFGSGPATRQVLEGLASAQFDSVQKEARGALARRDSQSPG